MIGTQLLTLNPISDINATMVDMVWDLNMNKIPVFVKGFAKDNFMKANEDALSKIEQTVK